MRKNILENALSAKRKVLVQNVKYTVINQTCENELPK